LGRFVRPLLAAGLLAALGWAAFQGVQRSTGASDGGRRADRMQIVRAAASSAAGWLQAGLDEAQTVASGARTNGAGTAVAAYAAGTHQFREALIVNQALHVAAGNVRYAAANGALLPCRRNDAPPDDSLSQVVRAASDAGVPTIRAVDDPSCRAAVAAAAPAGNGTVAVVLGEPAPFAARLDTLARLPNGRAVFVDPQWTSVGADGTVAAASADLTSYLADRRQHEGVADDASVLRAWVPLPGGWTVVADQGMSDFRGSAATQPSLWIPAAVAACFAFAILVVGFSDSRRRRALARADEVRSSFLAVVSHELRTPLTVLKGFVDTLLARWNHLEDDQREQLVERLAPQVRRLHRGVDRLLIAADIQRGANLRLGQEPVVLSDVVSEVADNFRPVAPLHTFVLDVGAELTVVGDRKAFAQALDQLVDNAVKYSPSGGSVVLRARRSSRRVELTVEDEGVGLPSDYSRIFEPLTQGEDVDRRVHDEGGVGVGLYIARALIDAMGGTVRAERRSSEPGTRLVVTLVAGPLRAQEGGQLAPKVRVHGQL
jgi:signal transduction histidine kinase